MHNILNTLYVMMPQAYAHLENATVRIDVEREKRLQVPLHHLAGLVTFGNVMVSPALMHRLADEGKSLVLLDEHGRFKARMEGPVSGNILLRQAQHKAAGDSAASLDELRSVEGEAARGYCGALNLIVKPQMCEVFTLDGHTRRPPLASQRQDNPDSQAAGFRCVQFDMATMQYGDLSDNGQAESAAWDVGTGDAIKALEHAFALGLGNSWAIVVDADHGLVIFFA
jgi:hypothetical protein